MAQTNPTTDAAQPPAVASVDVAALYRGDVINYVAAGDRLTGEVAHVERMTAGDWQGPWVGATHLVVFSGGAYARLSGRVDKLTGEHADAWRDEQSAIRERALLSSFLIELGERVAEGLPLTTMNMLSILYEVDSPADVGKAAGLYGQPAEAIKVANGYTRVEIRRGMHEVEFYCRNKPAEVSDVA